MANFVQCLMTAQDKAEDVMPTHKLTVNHETAACRLKETVQRKTL